MAFNNKNIFQKIFYREPHKHREPAFRYFFLIRIIPCLFAVNIFFIFYSCLQAEPARSEFTLGTLCSVNLYEQGNNDVYKEIFDRIREIENLMSVNIPSSDISLINAAAGIAPVKVHEETFNVIKNAVYYARLSDGAFDPSIGPIVSLWGIGNDEPRHEQLTHVPGREEIEKLLPLVNWHFIRLYEDTSSVFFIHEGMALDLGAIAKGYAADEAAKIIERAGIKRALIDLGGNIIVAGVKKDRKPWRVGVQSPDKARGETIGYLQITTLTAEQEESLPVKTIVTSGTYERFFEENGIRYHHIFDPSLGYPVQNGIISVTVIADVSMDADALSTAAFVLGYERGSALVESITGTEAVFVFDDKSIRQTSGANFILTDKTYNIKY